MKLNLARLAVFVLISVGLTVWIATQIMKTSFDPRYQLRATFDDVTGLFVDDVVKLSGVPVGKVTGIRVVDGRAEVDLVVDQTVDLPDDSVIAVRWRNLIGQRFVQLTPGESTEMLENGDRVERTKSVIDLGGLVNSLGGLAGSIDPQQLNELLVALSEAVSGNEANLSGLLADLDAVLATLAQRDETIGQLVIDYETITGTLAHRDQQIHQVVDNLVLISQVFADNEALVDQALGELGTLSSNLDIVLTGNADELAWIVENLAVVTGTARAHLGELEETVSLLPTAAQALFSTINGGEFVRANVPCIEPDPAPCTTPVLLAGEPFGTGTAAPGPAVPATTTAAPPTDPGVAGRLDSVDDFTDLLLGGW
ncbi:MAG: MCE family protein [Acidimicrobiales bacterium]